MKTPIAPIGDVLKAVFAGIEDRKTVSREEVEEAWAGVAGDGAAKHSKPVLFRKGVLSVHVDSSVWMQEHSMRKHRILKGLKSRMGKDRISEIHFKIGEF